MRDGLVLLGAGRCGVGLAVALHRVNIPLAAILSRSARSRATARRLVPGVPVCPLRPPLPAAEVYLLAVADQALQEVATWLAANLPDPPPRLAAHTSGLHPADVLQPLRRKGLAVGSLHPLVAFPPAGRGVALRGVTAAVEGDPGATRLLLRLARRLGMRPRLLAATHKPRYHAAAALAGNLTYVLVALAREMLLQIGFAPQQAREALAPLAQGACQAALAARGFERLSGALARGDAHMVSAHLGALPPEVAAAYRAVATAALPRLEGGLARAGTLPRLRASLTAPPACGSVSGTPDGEGR